MVAIDKDKFLKEWFAQQRRAKEIILLLMGQTGFRNINFTIEPEIIIIDEVPKIKITIKQFPVNQICSNASLDVDEVYYKTMEVKDFEKLQSDY